MYICNKETEMLGSFQKKNLQMSCTTSARASSLCTSPPAPSKELFLQYAYIYIYIHIYETNRPANVGLFLLHKALHV